MLRSAEAFASSSAGAGAVAGATAGAAAAAGGTEVERMIACWLPITHPATSPNAIPAIPNATC